MTQQEASERYHIPLSVLQECEGWGLCSAGQYDDGDLEQISTIMTLHDVGFTAEEAEAYMRLPPEQPDSSRKRLRMLEEKRNELLEEIHFHERRLQRLDYLRREIQR